MSDPQTIQRLADLLRLAAQSLHILDANRRNGFDRLRRAAEGVLASAALLDADAESLEQS